MKSNSGPVYWILPLSITFYHTAATPRGPKEWKHQYPWGQLINCHHFLSRTDCSFKQEIKYCTTHNSSECGSFRCSYMPQNKCHSSNQDPVFPVCVLLSCVLSFIFFPVSPSPVCVMDLKFSLRVCGCTPAADSCLSDSGTKSPASQFLLARPFSRLASSRLVSPRLASSTFQPSLDLVTSMDHGQTTASIRSAPPASRGISHSPTSVPSAILETPHWVWPAAGPASIHHTSLRSSIKPFLNLPRSESALGVQTLN